VHVRQNTGSAAGLSQPQSARAFGSFLHAGHFAPTSP
jgi:hypothetical protein